MAKKGGNISGGAGGRKKVYNKPADVVYKLTKQIHRMMLDLDIKRTERDPIVNHLKTVKAFLEKLTYTPTDEPLQTKAPKVEGAGNKRLLHEHEDAVKDAIVRGFSSKLIQQELYEKTGQVVHINTVNGFRNTFKETKEYEDAHNEYLKSVDTMRLYTKVGRIEEITNLYNDVMQRYEHSPTREYQNQLLKILDQARKESDSPAVYNFKMTQNNMQVNGSVTFNLLEKETERELFKRLPINELIIGRIAARTGKDPVLMMKRLQSSYYAAQAGVFGLASTEDDIKYPSELHYDIEDMVGKHNAIKAEEAQIIQQEDDPNENPSDIKQKLLDKIKAKKKGDENADDK